MQYGREIAEALSNVKLEHRKLGNPLWRTAVKGPSKKADVPVIFQSKHEAL
jgi:hypothetical protein